MGNLFLAFLLILVGLLLMVIELILFSGGVLFVLALGSIITGVAMTFASGTAIGVMTLVGLVVVIPLVVTAVFRFGPRTSWGSRMFLIAPDEAQSHGEFPANRELEQYRGRIGKTLSDLRPSGVTDFDGKRVDTITEGLMVEEGKWVKCVDVKEGRVIVRPVAGPANLAEMQL